MGKKEKGTDTRQHKRLKADFLLKYKTGNGSEAARVTNIKNISAGGVKFLTSEALTGGGDIRLSVLIPILEKTFRANAKVLRIRRLKKHFVYSVAVQFTDISPEDQKALNDYVESFAQDDEAQFLIDHANVVVRKN